MKISFMAFDFALDIMAPCSIMIGAILDQSHPPNQILGTFMVP
jgi:hypothetical protein